MARIADGEPFSPFRLDFAPIEHTAQLRCIAGADVCYRWRGFGYRLLRRTECGDEERLLSALLEFDALPALQFDRRRWARDVELLLDATACDVMAKRCTEPRPACLHYPV